MVIKTQTEEDYSVLTGIAFSKVIGDLYARWTLDSLTEIGYAVSVDFINRPQLFTDSDIPKEVVNLRMSYGTTVHFPNTAQRLAMMMPIFGKFDRLKPDANASSTPYL